MKKLGKTELAKYRTQLEALATRVRADTAGMLEQSHNGAGGKSSSELSNSPFHLGDMGTEEYLYDLNNTLLSNEQYIASEARDALQRLDDGKFGVCESCGKSIAKARLDAMPFARHCVECAEKNDTTPQVSIDDGRPHSPADTLAPEGEMDEDRRKRSNSLEFPSRDTHRGDVHAAGTAGGGTAIGGLGGTNEGHGDPVVIELDEATASGYFDAEDDRSDGNTPRSGRSGGAVGGTPAFKRVR